MVRPIHILTTTLLTTLVTANPEPRTTVITPLGPVTAVSISSSYLIHTGATALTSSSASSSGETTTGGGPASASPKSTSTSSSSPANSNSGSTQSVGAGKAVVALVGALAGAMLFGL